MGLDGKCIESLERRVKLRYTYFYTAELYGPRRHVCGQIANPHIEFIRDFVRNQKNNMAAPTFSSLPEELLDRIIHYSSDDRSSLHSLCLVSRDANRIATPALYSTISLRRDDFQHLRPLAVLLWTSPHHRAAVKSFTVRRAYGGNLFPWPSLEGLDDLIRATIAIYVKEGDKEQWFKQVRDGGDALPIASLLLRSLPYVGEMQFDGFMLVDPAVKEGRRAWVRGQEGFEIR